MSGSPDNAQLCAWLSEVADGDMRALRQLYDVLAPVVYRFALSRLDDHHEAESVVSEVMVQLWRQAARFEGRAKVKTWVLGIAHHKVMDVWRRTRPEEESLDTVQPARHLDRDISVSQPVEPDGELALRDADCQACFEACLKHLPSPHRQVLYLALVEEQPYQAIATILDCPLNTVKTRVFHARKFLQQCMRDWWKDHGQ